MAEYFISPSGHPNPDGTIDRPWSYLEDAITAHGPGNTFTYLPGFYRGPLLIPSPSGGWPSSRTIIRAQHKWASVIIGSLTNGILPVGRLQNVIISGFEVVGARGTGIKLLSRSSNVTIGDCWIHSSGRHGINFSSGDMVILERNLIEHNGTHPQFHHGVYVSGEGLVVAANVIRHNANYGFLSRAGLKASTLSQNVIHDHRSGGIRISRLDVNVVNDANRILSNTIVESSHAIHIESDATVRAVNNLSLSLESSPILCDNCSDPPHIHENVITGSPVEHFVDWNSRVFWLVPGSTARHTGSINHIGTHDFWGRRREQQPGVAPDVGAFDYIPWLTTDEARSSWYEKWPYRYQQPETPQPAGQGAIPQEIMPDLWAKPPQ